MVDMPVPIPDFEYRFWFYISEVVQQLRQEGQSINDEDLKYIWPTRHSNINVYGKYHFNLKKFKHQNPLRPLRNPSS